MSITAFAEAPLPGTLTRSTRMEREHWLRTDRLFMRPIRNADAEDYAELLSDPAVMRFVGLEQGKVLTHEETKYLVAGAVETWQIHGYGRWSLFDRQDMSFVGFSGFRCEEGAPEFISITHEKYWGRGFSREAARAVLEYGFDNFRFSEVRSFCRPLNARARTMLEKLGAEFLGLVDFHGVEGAAYRLCPSMII